MKVSNQSMEKLGFKKYGQFFQHSLFRDIKFNKRPNWEDVIGTVFEIGALHGEREKERNIKRALGI